MEFGNPVVGGVTLVRTDIESKGFVTGSAGWRIKRDGDAEFNSVTIRGNIALSDAYRPVTSVYDSSGGGAPTWATVGSFVLFSNTAWGAVDVVVPASGRIRYDIKIIGMNNTNAASTLAVDLESLISSGGLYPTAPAWVGPGTTDHVPNTADGALVASQVAANTSQQQTMTYLILDGLVPGTWYRFRPYWRIGQGGAANINFGILTQRFTVTPVV